MPHFKGAEVVAVGGGGVEWKQGKGERERYAAVEGVEKGKTRRN